MAQAINRKTGSISLEFLDNAVFSIFERLILKAEPNLTLEEKKELKEYIAINLGSITDEMVIALKQTTKEAVEKAKQDMIEEEDEGKKKTLTKSQRIAKFRQEYYQEGDADLSYAHAIHKVERETGIVIGSDFLFLKFWNLLQKCEQCEIEEEEMKSRSER